MVHLSEGMGMEAAKLTPFLEGFVLRCKELNLPGDRAVELLKRAAAVHPDLAAELGWEKAGVVGQVIAALAANTGNAFMENDESLKKAPAPAKAAPATPKYT